MRKQAALVVYVISNAELAYATFLYSPLPFDSMKTWEIQGFDFKLAFAALLSTFCLHFLLTGAAYRKGLFSVVLGVSMGLALMALLPLGIIYFLASVS